MLGPPRRIKLIPRSRQVSYPISSFTIYNNLYNSPCHRSSIYYQIDHQHLAYSAGVPQIILPFWADTFDFAERVEYLGIGLFGNRRASPNIDPEEFGHALLTVVGREGGKEASEKSIRDRANALGKIVRRKGGRKLACEAILSRIC